MPWVVVLGELNREGETMSTIIIQAQEAYAPVPGMIAVAMGKPALCRYEVRTLDEAIQAVADKSTELAAAGKNHQVRAICYGRKPRGWDAAKAKLCRDYIAR